MNEAKEWLSNHIEAPFNNRMYTAKEVYQLLNEFAQQVSREDCLKFANHYRENILERKPDRTLMKEFFKEWIKNQQ